MTPAQLKIARVKVRQHYRLKRPVTDVEVLAEIAMLRRRGITNLDDSQHRLASSLQIGRHPIDVWEDPQL